MKRGITEMNSLIASMRKALPSLVGNAGIQLTTQGFSHFIAALAPAEAGAKAAVDGPANRRMALSLAHSGRSPIGWGRRFTTCRSASSHR